MPIQIRASICLLTFNAGVYLRPQLESIINQLKDDDEIIIVDNNSSDNTRLVIESFTVDEPRIKLFCLNKNLGVLKGFELCISLSKGLFVFLCDQDDVWLPTRLEKQISSLECADLSICNASLVDENLVPFGYSTFDLRFPVLGWKNLYKNAFIGCNLAMTRFTVYHILPFPENIPMHDWYIAQIAYKLNLRIAILPEILHLYRRHSATASQTGFSSKQPFLKQLTDRAKLIRFTASGFS